jgi:hypothetical protein
MSRHKTGDHIIKEPRLPLEIVEHGDPDPTKREEKTQKEKAETRKGLWPGQTRPSAPGEYRVWG